MINTKQEAEAWHDYKRFIVEWAAMFGLLVARQGAQSLREAFEQAERDEGRSLTIQSQLRRGWS